MVLINRIDPTTPWNQKTAADAVHTMRSDNQICNDNASELMRAKARRDLLAWAYKKLNSATGRAWAVDAIFEAHMMEIRDRKTFEK